MKLLIITQKVDRNDSVLGAYHRWIEEFAQNCETVKVICLQKGEFHLPGNVEVLSLGKEEGRSRWKYLKRFYQYIWRERKNYDAVFVHMNEEYVLLAGLWWRLIGKRVGMFRNHIQGTWKTPLAVLLSHVVFCTSPHSYTAKFKKTKIVPAGIDIRKFRIKSEAIRIPHSILSIGRIDPVKNIDVFINALKILRGHGTEFKATIVGDPDPKNQNYYGDMRELAKDLEASGRLKFHPAVPNPRTPEFYHSREIFVNMTNSGSLDKTIFSAMASGMLPVICNVSFKSVIPDKLIFQEGNEVDMAEKLQTALVMDTAERDSIVSDLKKYVESHSLEKTIQVLVENLS